jgi:F-type H+-transporting ATPase subunit delta
VAVAQRIYAEALLEAARDQSSLPQVRDEFAAFAAALAASADLGDLLRNPQLDPEERRGAIDAVAKGASETFRNFLRLVAEKGRLDELPGIYEEWERLLAAEERILEVELTTAVELTDTEAEEIVGKLEKAAGRKVEATRRVDPDLIGGLILQAGSMRVDGSVRGRLSALRDELLARA